ncbi:hypothetical protein [Salipiger aestuarii]
MSYSTTRQMFKRPERLGTGEGAGIIAAYLAANLVMAVLI